MSDAKPELPGFEERFAEPLSEEEILKICFLQLIGGVDTSTGLLSHTFAWLSEHPEEKQRLLDDPELLKRATEEFLRWTSPAPALARTVTTETELGGQRLCPGDRLLLSWASANRDGAEFPDPDDVVLDRPANRHFAFGVGIHRCLGAQLGRLMGRVALEELLRRIPDYELPARSAVRHLPDCAIVYSLESLSGSFPTLEAR